MKPLKGFGIRTDGDNVSLLLTCIAPLLWCPALLISPLLGTTPLRISLFVLPAAILYLFSASSAWHLLRNAEKFHVRWPLYGLSVAGIWLAPFVMWGATEVLSYPPLAPVYFLMFVPMLFDCWLRPGIVSFTAALAATLLAGVALAAWILPAGSFISTLLVGLFAAPAWSMYAYARLCFERAEQFATIKWMPLIVLAATIASLLTASMILIMGMRGMGD